MWQTVGQDKAVAALQRALAQGRRAHAYLFVGPPQVGKATLALELAQALNCEGPEPPCHECTPCHRIRANIHADVQRLTVEAGNGGVHKDISIDQIREVGRAVSLRPFEGRCRVIIIDPADAMNEAAQNAFLKTLEEPPPDVVFVLVTSRPQALRATIHSRCQRLDFSPLPVARLADALRERWDVNPRQAELLARLARGRLGWAIAAHQDEEVMRFRHQALADMRALPERTIQERFAYAVEMASRFFRDRATVLAVLDLWREWWRDILLVAGGCQDAITNLDLLDILRGEAARYAMAQVVAFLRSLAATKRHLEENVNARLALEILMLDLPPAR
ncbi:MAG: DNA polymerase III subunit delta' [Dehalococcoidia bacterium]